MVLVLIVVVPPLYTVSLTYSVSLTTLSEVYPANQCSALRIKKLRIKKKNLCKTLLLTADWSFFGELPLSNDIVCYIVADSLLS
jgi:hypothetical protein